MNVIMTENQKTVDVQESYALRLIEQGKAILAPVSEWPKEDSEPAPEPVSKKKRKGDA